MIWKGLALGLLVALAVESIFLIWLINTGNSYIINEKKCNDICYEIDNALSYSFDGFSCQCFDDNFKILYQRKI